MELEQLNEEIALLKRVVKELESNALVLSRRITKLETPSETDRNEQIKYRIEALEAELMDMKSVVSAEITARQVNIGSSIYSIQSQLYCHKVH